MVFGCISLVANLDFSEKLFNQIEDLTKFEKKNERTKNDWKLKLHSLICLFVPWFYVALFFICCEFLVKGSKTDWWCVN